MRTTSKHASTAGIGLALALLVSIFVATAAPRPAEAQAAAETTRVGLGDAIHGAIDVSQERFADGEAQHVVLARVDVFADALSGSGLLGDGPLLYTPSTTLDADTAAEIARVLRNNGVVYVLGGPQAIADETVSDLQTAGHDVIRLAGADRVSTSLAIAAEVRRLYGASGDVLAARAFGDPTNPGSGWVDSVAGGAWAADRGRAVVLVPTGPTPAAITNFLTDQNVETTHVLGGTAAISKESAAGLPGVIRHAGGERTETAAAIATSLWGAKTSGPRSFTVADASLSGAWNYGLAGAGIAADNDAPLVVVADGVRPATRSLVRTCGTPEVALTLLGDGQVIDGGVREYLDQLDGQGCGPDGDVVLDPALTAFGNCDAAAAWFREQALERVTPYGLGTWGYWIDDIPQPLPMTDAVARAPAEEADASAGAESASDSAQAVSGTNNQEASVDESDIVKNTNGWTAVVRNGEVIILSNTSATPSELAIIDLDTDDDDTLTIHGAEMQLSGTRLLITATGYRATHATRSNGQIERHSDIGRFYDPGDSVSVLSLYDMTAPSSPRLLDSAEIDGTVQTSRLVGDAVRLVVSSEQHGLEFTTPTYDDNGRPIVTADDAYNINRAVVQNSPVTAWLPRFDGSLGVECTDVYRPPVWSGLGMTTVYTMDLAGGVVESSHAATVVASGEAVYASQNTMVITTSRWGNDFAPTGRGVSTELHMFDISDPASISYQGAGRIGGYLINQFALSEHDGNIRVAATTSRPWRRDALQPQSFVEVFSIEGDQPTSIGRVDGLGINEQIQSVRFLGDLGLVVTFRQIDPLYVLDLSDPTDPTVTGELKITGFSEYLHDLGNDRILGIGVAADDDGLRTGAQASIFDISNPARPTMTSRVEFENGYSSVGYDHRSFTYWPTTAQAMVPLVIYDDDFDQLSNLVVLDVEGELATNTSTTIDVRSGQSMDAYGEVLRTWINGNRLSALTHDGVVVFDLATLNVRGSHTF